MLLQDNASFLHLIWWSSESTGSSTIWDSTGLLVADSIQHLRESAQLAGAAVSGSNSSSRSSSPASDLRSSYVATNSSLVPIIRSAGGVSTMQPLLVYVATNVTLGPLVVPAEGIAVNRPLYLVGLRSSNTSVDFQMLPNQLRLLDMYSNITMDYLLLENMCYGNDETAKMNKGADMHITANVFGILYDR